MSIIHRIGDKCFQAVQALPEPVRPRMRPRRPSGSEQAPTAPTEQGLDGVWRPIGQAAEQAAARPPRPRVIRRTAEAAQGNPAPRSPSERLVEVACPGGPIDRLLPLVPAIPGAIAGGGLAPERPVTAPPPSPPAIFGEASPYRGPVIHGNIPGIGSIAIPMPDQKPYVPDLMPRDPIFPTNIPGVPGTPPVVVTPDSPNTPVPSPSSMALLGTGVAALGVAAWRRRREQPAESHRARVEESPKEPNLRER